LRLQKEVDERTARALHKLQEELREQHKFDEQTTININKIQDDITELKKLNREVHRIVALIDDIYDAFKTSMTKHC
jgi:predicted ATPase